MKEHIRIFDTTLRDGEQSPGYSMNLEEKLKMAALLDDIGVDIIEAGFPAASKGDFEAVEKVAQQTKNAIVAGLCRAVQKDIDAVAESVKAAKRRRIHTFISTSDLHIEHKLQTTRDRVLEMVKESVSYARRFADDVEWSAEDATRTDHDFLARCVEAAIAAGATTVNIPDTVGYTVPDEYFKLIGMLKTRVPNIDKAILSAHCHNDLGLAVANSLAAVSAGARQVECTINGIGERAGNAALEEIVMALKVRGDIMPFDTKIETTKIMSASKLLSDITGFSVQPNKAVVGANAFAHESGIHQDGMLKNSKTYEIMTPESVGRSHTDLVLGKHSGRNAFRSRLVHLGIDLPDDQLNEAFARFKDFADIHKKISDDDLRCLAANDKDAAKPRLVFVSLQLSTVTGGQQHAEVTITFDGETHAKKAIGKGPVDAAYKAIRAIVPHDDAILSGYELKSLEDGSEAKGAVTLRLTEHGTAHVGTGVDTDVIVASVLAYLDALNKLVSARHIFPVAAKG